MGEAHVGPAGTPGSGAPGRCRGVALKSHIAVAGAHVSKADLSLVVFEELNRLREKYRLPLILCYLKGLTTAEVRKTNHGCPQGTIHSRPSAREQCSSRLISAGAYVVGLLV